MAFAVLSGGDRQAGNAWFEVVAGFLTTVQELSLLHREAAFMRPYTGIPDFSGVEQHQERWRSTHRID
ncbi:hypothetical protein AZ003_002815 [Citrobacter freundii]|uniref:hypothetical protein n=1 Tax=Citrobacter freundii TaxID=546 RepID=UPI000A39221C|nr:hypothetical protein [Citrobacter freundii]OUE53908.1 hypothetical protein AZ003_002815 [Citrobacter freundii]